VSRALVLVAILTCACTAHQARVAKRVGEATAAAALIGMLTTIAIAAAHPGSDTELLEIGAIFVPFTVGGALVYVAGDSALAPVEAAAPAPAHSSSWQAAMSLAKQAKHAARRGDCAEVQAIEPRVRELDDEVFARFERDEVIGRCLTPPASPPAAATGGEASDLRPQASGRRPQASGSGLTW
jgi:hypothetical protein